MQTNFSLAQLADPAMATSEKILRTCVHCGFCTATCPTYLLLGDELDSPARPHLPDQGHARGRQGGERRGGQARRPLPVVPVVHDDLPLGRALHAPRRSCPRHIEETFARRLDDRALRAILAAVLPYPRPVPAGAVRRPSSARRSGPWSRACRVSATGSPRCSISPRRVLPGRDADQSSPATLARRRSDAAGEGAGRAAARLRAERAAARISTRRRSVC